MPALRYSKYAFVALLVLLLAALALVWGMGLALPARQSARIDRIAAGDAALPLPAGPSAGLPAPVQRLAARLPAAPLRGVSMRSTGRVILPGNTEWSPIEGRQYVSSLRPAFLWTVRLAAGPLWVDVQDHYEDCTGRITTRGFGLLPLMSEDGVDELSITQLVRWSGLATMAPTALVTSPAITWEPVDDRTAAATITDCGLTARHVFHFDAEGRVIRTESNDRYELFPGEGYKPTGSVMHRLSYQDIEGYPIPLREEVIRIEDGREVLFLEETFSDIVLHR